MQAEDQDAAAAAAVGDEGRGYSGVTESLVLLLVMESQEPQCTPTYLIGASYLWPEWRFFDRIWRIQCTRIQRASFIRLVWTYWMVVWSTVCLGALGTWPQH